MSAITSQRPKLSAWLIDALRADIETGRIRGGQKLPSEAQLTTRFGVSRTVVREALAALAADGLIQTRQGAGAFAVQPRFASLSNFAADKISIAINVLEVRMGIEIESAGLAAQRRSASQEAAIHEAFHEFDRLLQSGEATGKADFAFHRAIAAATSNPFYLEVLDALGSRTIPCDVTSPWGTDRELTRDYQVGLQAEHAQIMESISAGDANEARAAMRAHLGKSQQRYRARLVRTTATSLPGTT